MSQQINLFNPIYLQREKQFSAVSMLWTLLAFSIAVAGNHAYGIYHVRSLEERARYYDAMAKSKRSEMADTVARYSPEGRNKQLEAEIKSLESMLASREDFGRALRLPALEGANGFSGYFEAFSRRTIAGLWLTGFSIAADGDLLIQGRVLRPELVPDFLGALGEEKIMRGRKVVELKLEAREQQDAGAAPGARKAGSAPLRFVEFAIRAQMQSADSGAVAAGALPSGSGGAR